MSHRRQTLSSHRLTALHPGKKVRTLPRTEAVATGRQWLPLLLVLILPGMIVLISNLRTLCFDFAYDDARVVAGAGDLVRDDFMGALLSFKRPLRTFSFALDEWMFGREAWGYHLDSVLWASLNASLVVLLAYAISGRRRISLCAGVLFAVHPVHVEAVANIANRKDLIAFAFGIAAVAVLCRPLLGKRFPGIGRMLAATVLVLLCALGKEVAALGVIGVICLLVLVSLRSSRDRKHIYAYKVVACLIIPVFALLVGTVVVKRYLLPIPELFATDRLAYLSSGLIETPADWVVRSLAGVYRSFSLLCFPLRLSADHPVPPGGLVGIVQGAFGVLLLLGTVALGFRVAERLPLMSAGLVWFLPTMLPVINIVPISHFFVAERYLYLPSLGAAFVGAAILDLLAEAAARKDKRLVSPPWVIGLSILAMLATVRSVLRIDIWRDSRSLWSTTCRDSPKSWRARIVMGEIFEEEGAYDEAIAKFREASQILPAAARPHLLIGEVLMKRGAKGAALEQFLEAARLEPNWNLAKKALSEVYHSLGVDSAVRGDWAAAYNAFGAECTVREDWAAAENYFLKALSASPTDAEVLCNLAKVRIILKKYPEASESLNQGHALVGDRAWCGDLPG